MARGAGPFCHKPLIVKSLGDLTFPLCSCEPPITTINNPLKKDTNVDFTVLTLGYFFGVFFIHTNNIRQTTPKVKNLFKFFYVAGS